jgi:hypothetical protein
MIAIFPHHFKTPDFNLMQPAAAERSDRRPHSVSGSFVTRWKLGNVSDRRTTTRWRGGLIEIAEQGYQKRMYLQSMDMYNTVVSI